MKFLRQILIVARYELIDAVKSRRAALVLLLYLATAMLACNGFISALHRMEMQLADILSLPASSEPGVVLDALWKSKRFLRLLEDLIGNSDVVKQILVMHPIAIVYGWLIFLFTPIFVMLTASTRIAEEVDSGSASFVLLRCPRSAWCIGKYMGQAAMLILALTLSALGSWCLAKMRLMGMNDLSAAQGMIIYSWKAWVYSLSFLGIALGVSQLTSSPHKATAFGFGAWVLLTVLGWTAFFWKGDGWAVLWQVVHMMVPLGHKLDLWHTDFAHQMQGTIFLIMLGIFYMYLGYIFFNKKDL